MVQFNNQHLTTEQLSAYVDQEMAADELALCDAHLRTCQACQAGVADLQFTSTLLRKMPQVEVPRSFALPTNLLTLPTTSTPGETRQASRGRARARRSLRIISTFAAVLGLVFILFGAFTSLTQYAPSGGASTAAPASSGATPRLGNHSSSSELQATQTASANGTQTAEPASTPVIDETLQPSVLPPLLDPGLPIGRLGIGTVLVILGLLGVLLTRRLSRSGP